MNLIDLKKNPELIPVIECRSERTLDEWADLYEAKRKEMENEPQE